MNIKKELIKAKRINKTNPDKAFELYNELFEEHPEQFSERDINQYCWAIFQSSYDSFKSCKLITSLTKQKKVEYDVYSASVVKVLKILDKNKDYIFMYYWLNLINPDLLIKSSRVRNGKLIASNAQKYYTNASKAYFYTKNYKRCIKVSEKSLNSDIDWIDDGEYWQKFKIAQSLIRLNRFEEALNYLIEVESVIKGNKILMEFAEVYYGLGDFENALDCALKLALRLRSNVKKENCLLLAKIIKEKNYIIAEKHEELAFNPDKFNIKDFIIYWEDLKTGVRQL